MASKTSAISCALYFSVPLKSRCSMKWETPARSWRSSLDPAPIQNPSATERTCVSRSVTTRWPESSSERTYFCTDGSYWRPRLLALREPCHETARPAAAGSVTHPGVIALVGLDEGAEHPWRHAGGRPRPDVRGGLVDVTHESARRANKRLVRTPPTEGSRR